MKDSRLFALVHVVAVADPRLKSSSVNRCRDVNSLHLAGLLILALPLGGCLALQDLKLPSSRSSTTPGVASLQTNASPAPALVQPTTASRDTTRKQGCAPPMTPIGRFCLRRAPTDETFGEQLTLLRPDGTEVWSGVASGISEATEDHFDVLEDYRGNMGGQWTSTRWVRKGDGFVAGKQTDLWAEEERREAEAKLREVDEAWAAVEQVGDDLATKKFLHGFAVQHTTGARNARAAQRMVEHMAMITKDDFCPAVKSFVTKSSKAEYAKRAKSHCDDNPPTAGGLNGEPVECRNECRAVFATTCP